MPPPWRHDQRHSPDSSLVPGPRFASLGGFDEFGELFRALRPALVEAHFLVLLAIGDRPVRDARSILRLSGAGILERERERHERLLRRLPRFRVGIGRDDALVGHDFEEDAGTGDFRAIGSAHDEKARATRAHVEFSVRRGVGARRNPLLEQLRLGPGGVNFVARGVDDAGEQEFTAGDGGRRFRGGFGFGGHRVLGIFRVMMREEIRCVRYHNERRRTVRTLNIERLYLARTRTAGLETICRAAKRRSAAQPQPKTNDLVTGRTAIEPEFTEHLLLRGVCVTSVASQLDHGFFVRPTGRRRTRCDHIAKADVSHGGGWVKGPELSTLRQLQWFKATALLFGAHKQLTSLGDPSRSREFVGLNSDLYYRNCGSSCGATVTPHR